MMVHYGLTRFTQPERERKEREVGGRGILTLTHTQTVNIGLEF